MMSVRNCFGTHWVAPCSLHVQYLSVMPVASSATANATIANDETSSAEFEWVRLPHTYRYEPLAGTLVRRDRELLQNDHFTILGASSYFVSGS